MPAKARIKPRYSSRKWYRKIPTWGWAVLVIGIVGFGAVLATLIAITPATTPSADEGTYIINVDRVSGDEIDDVDNDIYACDTTGLSSAEIAALIYANFTKIGTNESGDSFTAEDNYVYFIRSTCASYTEVWWIPVAGCINTISMLHTATNISLLMMSETLQTNVVGSTEQNWMLWTQSIDAEGLANNTCGFTPVYDFSGGDDWEDFGVTFTSYTVLNITLDATADEDFVEWTGLSGAVTADGNNLYVAINGDVIGLRASYLTFDGLGDDFNITSFEIGYGSVDSYGLLNKLV